VAVHPYRLGARFSSLREVRQYRAVQHDGGLLVRVVLQASAPADTPARVRAAVVEALASAGAVPPPIEVVPVEAIERESGHAAKLKLVKRAAQRGGKTSSSS
jgi:ATP sulfurylase